MRLAIALVLLVGGGSSGCGVVWDAPKVSLVVTAGSIDFAITGQAALVTGGETVLTLVNDSNLERQVVLARLAETERGIPSKLADAVSPREDDRILGVSPKLPARRLQASGLYRNSEHRFHVYLEPGQQYVLFDRLGGAEDGLVLRFTPGPDGRG